jgi:hypothetical protein
MVNHLFLGLLSCSLTIALGYYDLIALTWACKQKGVANYY